MTCNERLEAVRILVRLDQKEAYASDELDILFRKHPEWRREQKSLITKLVYTVLTYDLRLDCFIDLYSRTPVRRMDPYIRQVMRISAAQLLFLTKIPQRAVVNEAVALVKQSACKNLSGYVNAVLRAAIRGGLRESWPEAGTDPIAHWSVRASLPKWMLEMWRDAYGLDVCMQTARNLSKPRPLSIRVNRLRTDPEQLMQELGDRKVRKGLYVEDALQLVNPGDITELPAFKEGRFTVQDESSMLCVRALDPQPGEKILDLCAAPGGKSTYMAERMRNSGLVEARDISDAKCARIMENVERLGTSIVTAKVSDAAVPRPEDAGRWDRVLLDAPCSGLGVLRNKPDMKQHRGPEDLAELAKLQRQMMETAAQAVRPGGVFVYSTCTLSPAENEENVASFLADHPEFARDPLPEDWPEIRFAGTASERSGFAMAAAAGMLTIFPETEGLDGFFIARMRRNVGL